MKKLGNVAIFMDYNGTFDDLEQGKGQAMIYSLRKFVDMFENAQIVVVTGAKSAPEDCSIRAELAYCIGKHALLTSLVTHLVEENCRTICDVVQEGDGIHFRNQAPLAADKCEKSAAVEAFLQKYDPEHKISCCVFAGDDAKFDVNMLSSNVGEREKFMIYANRKILKSEKPLKLCKVSHSTVSFHSSSNFINPPFGSEMLNTFGDGDEIVFNTDKNSYGVAMGLGALANFLTERESQKSEHKPQGETSQTAQSPRER